MWKLCERSIFLSYINRLKHEKIIPRLKYPKHACGRWSNNLLLTIYHMIDSWNIFDGHITFEEKYY